MTPVLDRLVEFDPRSRSYPIRTLVPATFRSYTWRPNVQLDQGNEGACVGFAWSHELAARPWPVQGVSDLTARAVYDEARKVDQWPGEDYSGTSVIAGAKVVQEQGWIGAYRWAFGLDDLRRAIGFKGPAVLGLNWYQGMLDTDGEGFIHPSGSLAGGHAILAYSVSESGGFIRVHNSWGASWGVNGDAKITFHDLNRLLNEDGEACIPVERTLG